MNVAVLGASPKPDRYANKAIRLLQKHHHDVIPINPAYEEIEGLRVVPSLETLAPKSIDTVTVYMGADRTNELGPALIHLSPRRVIFNPGAENPALAAALQAANIEVVEACTLVMLNTNQF